MVLSHGYWRTRFAADPSIVGRTLTLNGTARDVVGVMPPSFDFSSVFTPGVGVDFVLPYPVSDETDRHGNELVIIGRMRPGVTPEAAQAELDAVLVGLQDEQPDRWGLGARLTPLQTYLAGPFRPAFVLLAAAAGTLLLIVCVNVSNLLLARSPGRAREVAVRKALGAPRSRLARQFVLEVLGIALAGAGVGGGLAWGVTHLVAGTAMISPTSNRKSSPAASAMRNRSDLPGVRWGRGARRRCCGHRPGEAARVGARVVCVTCSSWPR